jgi:hypothetical protein
MECEILCFAPKLNNLRAFLAYSQVAEEAPVLLHVPRSFLLGDLIYDTKSKYDHKSKLILSQDKPILYIGEKEMESFLRSLEKRLKREIVAAVNLNDEQISTLKNFGEQFDSTKKSLSQKIIDCELRD